MPPVDREIRKRGSLIAAEISWAWLVAALAGTVAFVALGSGLYAVPAYVAIGGAAAMPVSAGLGWHFAPAGIDSSRVRGMAIWTVFFTDIEISCALGVLAAANNDHAAILYATVGIPYGLLLFGLPGLAMAIPSAWLWQRMMRRTFKKPIPAGGDRGSGDPPR